MLRDIEMLESHIEKVESLKSTTPAKRGSPGHPELDDDADYGEGDDDEEINYLELSLREVYNNGTRVASQVPLFNHLLPYDSLKGIIDQYLVNANNKLTELQCRFENITD